MDDKQVGTELKAALVELRNLASQLVNNSRDWLENRRQEMNHGNKPYGQPRDARRGEREARGYGEGYGTSGMQGRPREEDWEDASRNGGDDQRWGSGRESDADVRSQYGGGRSGGYDPGGYSQRGGGRERSGFSEYASGQREYGSAFDDSDFGAGRSRARSAARGAGRFGEERDGGYYSRPGRAEGGEYSQGYGRERDEGRAYGPEDFSQRYAQQGDVFDDQGYGDPGSFADQRPQGGGDWRRHGGPSVSGSWRGGGQSAQGGHAQGRSYAQDYGQAGYGRQNDQRARGAGAYSGYAENDRNQQNFRGRGPRGYTRSDERITEDLNERLTDDWQLDADDIQVSVSAGVATLTGTVPQRWLKHHAEDLAESCSGVKDVRNEIRVVGSGGRDNGDTSATSGSSAYGSTSASSTGGTGVGGDTETGNRARTGTPASGKAGGSGTQAGGNTH
jgi:osmotically-inducible protein OsmY